MRLTPVELIVTFILLTCWAPLAADAQPPAKVIRIGYLSVAGELQLPFAEAFRQELRTLGWVEGRTSPLNLALRKGDPSGSPPSPPNWSNCRWMSS